MRKALLSILVSLTLALGFGTSLAFAAPGGLSVQDQVYKVTFVGQDGTTTESINVAENGTIAAAPEALLTAAGNAGYTLEGWYTSATTQTNDTKFTVGDTSPTQVTGETTLYGKWVGKTYTVQYSGGYLHGGISVTAVSGGAAPTSAYYKVGEGVVDNSGNALNSAGQTSTEWVAAATENTAENFVQATTITVASNDTTKNYNPESNDFTKWNTKVSLDNGAVKVEGSDLEAGATLGEADLVAQQDNMSGDVLTLSAQWQAYWTVTFIRNGYGTQPEPEKYKVEYNADGTAKATTINKPDDLISQSGYKFEGWYKVDAENATVDPATATKWDFENDTISADTILKAGWSPAQYTVTFTLDGYTIPSLTKGTGDTTGALPTKGTPKEGTAEETFAKTGYHIYQGAAGTDSGWYTDEACTKPYDAATLITGDLDLYAKWEANTYTIAFDGNDNGNGNTTGLVTSQTKTYGTDLTLSKNTITHNTNKAFLGWKTKDGNGNLTGSLIKDEAVITEDLTAEDKATVTLYAVWEDSFFVGFYKNDGTTENDPAVKQLVPTNSTSATLDAYSTMKDTIKREHYEFVKWSTSATAAAGSSEYGDGASVAFERGIESNTEALSLYAQWKGDIYTVDFDANGGWVAEGKTAPATQRMQYGSGLVNADDVAIDATGKTAAEIAQGETFTQAADVVFPIMSTTYGAATNVFERTGYTFAGWNTKADGTGTAVSSLNGNTSVKANTTLYAQWTANSVDVEYKWAAADNDATSDASYTPAAEPADAAKVTYTYGATAGTTEWAIPSLNGFAKTGYDAPTVWVDANDATKTYTPGDKFNTTTFDASVTLKPKWVAKKFTVTFKNQDDKILDTQTVDYNTTAAYQKGLTPVVPTFAGETNQYKYTFAGWAKVDTAEAAAKKNGSTATTDINSIQGATPAITADATYYAVYTTTASTFTAYYDANGLEGAVLPASATSINWEATVTKPADAKADGYAFEGWYLADAEWNYKADGTIDTTDPYTVKSVADEAYDFAAKVTDNIVLAAKWTATDEAKNIAIPTAKIGVVYTGEELAGVEAGTGFTLTGNTGTEVGDYTATATLEAGYVWADGSATPKEIAWSIGNNPADINAAKAVSDAIAALPEATADNKAAIAAVVDSYEALSDTQQALVDSDAVSKLYAAASTANSKAADADAAAYEVAKKAAEDAKAAYEAAQAAAEKSGSVDDAKTAVEKAAAYQAAATAAKTALDNAVASAAEAGNTELALKLINQSAEITQGVTEAATATKTAAAAKTAADKANAGKTAAKKANTLKVTLAKKTVKAKAKKKTAVKAAVKIAGAQGKVTVKTNNKKVKVTKAGKVTVKKGLKKGKTYKVKVTVTAAGNASYKSATKAVTLKVKVK